MTSTLAPSGAATWLAVVRAARVRQRVQQRDVSGATRSAIENDTADCGGSQTTAPGDHARS